MRQGGRGKEGREKGGRAGEAGRRECINPIGTCHSQDSVSFFFFFFFFFFQYQETPLHRAARWNKIEAVAALISHGADVNARERDGVTPLMRASFWGHAKVVEALLDAGADKELKATSESWKGKSALEMARSQNNGDVVAILERR